jgi:alpha-tubulin suppressor-like RCC1 family protein
LLVRRVLPAVLTAFLAAGLLLTGSPTSAAQAAPTYDTFTAQSPVRLLDTRDGTGPIGAGGTIAVDLATRVPAASTAVVLNVTGVDPTAHTFVSVYPSGTARPISSNLNLAPGSTRPNQVTVTLGADRKVNLFNNAGSIHFVVDLAGHYGTGAGARFTAMQPNRVLDTRTTNSPIGPGGTRVVSLANAIPASATAVTFNLTATNVTAGTFVTAWPTDAPLPNASNLNVPPGDTRPNLVTVAVGANRQVSLFNNAGSVDLIVDVTGFYTPDYGAFFVPQDPSRLLDTRDGTGPVQGGTTVDLLLEGKAPLTASGAVLNITGVDATAGTFVTAWPQYENPPPVGSMLNISAGETVPNAAVVTFGRALGIQLYNNAGSVHLIADLAGYFTVLDRPSCATSCVNAWGDNFSRKLGTAQAEFYSSTWAQVVALPNGTRAVDGSADNAYTLHDDGTVSAWGANASGQLGNGWTGGGSAVPVPVVGLTGATAITAGGATAFALRGDGTVWAWGANPFGVLGNGSSAASSAVPVRVAGLTGVTSIATTGTTTYAVRNDGTVWSWGAGSNGALGNGSTAASAVPVQVFGLTGVNDVAAGGDTGLARRADGSVWAWGDNTAGQLGNGSAAEYSTVPVPVTGLSDATAIAAGPYNGYAVLADGTVRSWGAGSNGALGNGVDCSGVGFPCASRVTGQVSNLRDVKQVASFEYGGYALHTDGTVSSWGFNGYGSLGNSVYWESLVPVPVEDARGVSTIGAGEYSGYAVW